MELYGRYYKSILNGYEAKPRGLETTYLHNIGFYCDPYTLWRRPKDNIMIGIMEGLQFIGGVFDKKNIARVAPNAQLDLFTGQSAYGPRCGRQVSDIIELLRKDKYTRQAVLLLADPKEPLHMRPCTTSLQFQINQFDTLVVTANMRSSDAIWGLPYDIIQFNFMAHMVAMCSGYLFRSIHINMANAHVYKSTRLDAPTFTRQFFTLPESITDLDEWREWARERIPWITYEDAKRDFIIRSA